MGTTILESYEIMVAQDKSEVFIPVLNLAVELEGKETNCHLNNDSLHLCDGKNTVVFEKFPAEHWELVRQLGKICFLDVSDKDHMQDFVVPLQTHTEG